MASHPALELVPTTTQWAATGTSHHPDARRAGADAAAQALSGDDATLLVVFSSDAYDLTQLLAGIAGVSADVPVIGCSTAGEIAAGGIRDRDHGAGRAGVLGGDGCGQR